MRPLCCDLQQVHNETWLICKIKFRYLSKRLHNGAVLPKNWRYRFAVIYPVSRLLEVFIGLLIAGLDTIAF